MVDWDEAPNFCYCCIPIHVAITMIGAIIIFTFVVTFLVSVVFIFNVYFASYYGLACMCMSFPILVPIIFFTMYWIRDSQRARNRLKWGVIIAMASVFILQIFALVYITLAYDKQNVYLGTGPSQLKAEKEG